MREIVLDTETTGLEAHAGDRIVEIGAVELMHGVPTGHEYHCYINPERAVPAEAAAVHGLDDAFLADKPAFAAQADAFLDFIADARLVIHNAPFDIGFLNTELDAIGHPRLGFNRVIDTLAIARRKFPMGPNSLDALCTRFGVDRTARVTHGALLDARLLAEVYIELNGGRQATLLFGDDSKTGAPDAMASETRRPLPPRPAPLPDRLDAQTTARHRVFIAGMGDAALWWRYVQREE